MILTVHSHHAYLHKQVGHARYVLVILHEVINIVFAFNILCIHIQMYIYILPSRVTTAGEQSIATNVKYRFLLLYIVHNITWEPFLPSMSYK